MANSNSSMPSEQNQENKYTYEAPELKNLISIIWQDRKPIFAFVFVFTIIAAFIAMNSPNLYRSDFLLSPSQESNGGGLSAIAGRLGGLASLAGLNIEGDVSDKSALAVHILQSRDFINKLVKKYELVLPLMAVKDWDPINNILLYESDIYNKDTQTWVRLETPLKTSEPTPWEIYNEFTKHYEVDRDKKSGLVTISFEHVSPYIAQEWTSYIVNEINLAMRESELALIRKNIAYLNKQVTETSVSEMQDFFYELIQEQSKSMMLAQAKEEFIFTIIDPAIVAEEKHSPKRALIIIVAIMLSGLFGIFISIIKYNFK